MNDDDRVRLAVRVGSRMLGPIEHDRCLRHPRCKIAYRWRWDADGDISGGWLTIERGCYKCREGDC